MFILYHKLFRRVKIHHIMNKLFWNENLLCLKALINDGVKADFVYIDPPFFSNADYKASVRTASGSVKINAYGDKWRSIEEFVAMLEERMLLIKELLKDSGTVALHLDTHAVHYAKVMMDRVFGPENFVNDVIWCYKSGGAGRKGFARKHDNILLYSKTSDYWFEAQKQVSYNRGGRPYNFKGITEYMDKEGRWYTLVNQKDVINVDMVGRTSAERTGYATQKPEKLLEIFVKSCCPEGGLCADYFCGSGTLGAVCHKLRRKYILCDSSPVAMATAARRLSSLGSEYELFKAHEMRLPEKLDVEVESELRKYLIP